ncbi:MAG: arsenate reductase family protein [Christensenellales bacterium]|jgi:arsenate reductase
MNIQIFGRQKCFDTKKAERYFKERRIKYQMVDIGKYGMSKGELNSVIAALGLKNIIDENAKGYKESMVAYTSDPQIKAERLLESQQFIKTPIVRNGRKATLGHCPDVWKTWEQ